MLLENKVAIIYGGGGAIGGAVARAFAREGAKVYLAGRTKAKLEKVAEDIRAAGGTAETDFVDALNENAVDEFVDSVALEAGYIDISFNLIGYADVQEPLNQISLDNFMLPIVNAMRSHFLTSRAAARHMVKRGSGVIMTFGGSGPQTLPNLGGFKIALDAIEGLRRQLAVEFGGNGIRVITLKTGGIPESIDDSFPAKAEITTAIENDSLLKKAATLADVGNVAAFAASDLARTMTSTEINISCGAIVD